MIVQVCINGARPDSFHPALPLTLEDMVRDNLRCIEAGASELDIHPRNADARESLVAVDALIVALPRHPCRHVHRGRIEGNETATRQCISNWQALPDHASVNLSERNAPAIIAQLGKKDVGVEAGLVSVKDAERFVSLPQCQRVFRIEIEEQDLAEADRVARGIERVLEAAGVARPILLHGFGATVWPLIHRARQKRWSISVGLEDSCLQACGHAADSNADLVAAAMKVSRQASH